MVVKSEQDEGRLQRGVSCAQGWLRDVQPQEDLDGPQARHFRARQIQALLSLLPLVTLGNAVNTITVCWIFWSRVNPFWLSVWCLSVVLSPVSVALWWRAMVRPGVRPMASRQAARLVTAQVMVFAAVWATLPMSLFPGADQTGSLLLATLSVGMICGGAFMLSPMAPAAMGFVVVLFGACAWALLRSGYANSMALLLMLTVYAVIMVGVVFTNGRVFLSRMRAEAETERQKQLIDLLLRDFEEHASDWLWEISASGHLKHVSARLSQSFGMPSKQLLQKSLVELLTTMLPPDDPEGAAALAQLTSCIRLGQPFRDLEMPVEVGHEVRWWSLTAKPLFDERGRAAGWRGVGSDITQARQTRDELARLANFDALTGLANRHRFSSELARLGVSPSALGAFAEAALSTGGPEAAEALALAQAARPCALIFIDLDNFKHINDTLGHSVGDQLLRRLGARLRSCVAEGDLLARLGGDEFALLTWRYASHDAAAALAERLLVLISEPCQLDDAMVEVRASIGVAQVPFDGHEPTALLQCADLALYAAKAAGRNTYRFFEASMADHARARVRLQHELGQALQTDQFLLYFQPQLLLDSNEVIGFEALVRWQHSQRGLIGPGEFIPVAEETGQIVPLGNWVLREACRQAAQWPGKLRVSVNLSAVQFRSSAVIDLVDEALARSGLAPERLEIEITESALIEDHDSAQATLTALRTRGVRVALDDFGTGYSSLAYLRRFPMDKLKIDGMFVRSLDSDTGAQAVVTAIISLAKALRLETTAEGVEAVEQLVMLKALGCDDVQGYLISRPMPGGEVADYLRSGHGMAA
jgi:diguanylate cyclase (GGDEF)-like protein/PAS domain S-box-containing protein